MSVEGGEGNKLPVDAKGLADVKGLHCCPTILNPV